MKSSEELIDFALRWQPYGGGDDEIFVTFGIMPSAFYLRVIEILRTQPELAGSDLPQLEDLCRRKVRGAKRFGI